MENINGIIKKVDSLGRLTIPKSWRQVCQINSGDEVIIYLIDNNTIGIKKVSTLSENKV